MLTREKFVRRSLVQFYHVNRVVKGKYSAGDKILSGRDEPWNVRCLQNFLKL